MRRRRFIISAGCLGALVGARNLLAQQQSKVWRVGFLWPLMRDSNPDRLSAFRQGLKESGYVEGRNITIEDRWAEGKYDRLPGLAAELVGRKVGIRVASATPPSLAAGNARKAIPGRLVNVHGQQAL